MSWFRRWIERRAPARAAQSIEAESRSWVLRCLSCGHGRTIWDLGGVRWGAAGEPRRRLRCPSCARPRWHKLTKEDRPDAPDAGSV